MSEEFPEYHKIQSLFKRDEYNNFIIGEWTLEEFGYLQDNDWIWTEKVDGINTRIQVNFIERGIIGEFRGRTDNAQWSKPVAEMLESLVHDIELRSTKNASEMFQGTDTQFILYGEAYGAGINKGGAYSPTPKFILFDVKINGVWLSRENMQQIADILELDVVPIKLIGHISLAMRLVQHIANGESTGLSSSWKGVEIEGLVGVPTVPLRDRRGNRIITKMKVRDFQVKK